MVSTDGGKSWEEQLVPGSVGCVHMNLAALTDSNLLALYRSRWAESIYYSCSEEAGLTWSEPVPTELPNSNSSIQFAALDQGRMALIYNDSKAAADAECHLSFHDEIDDEGWDETVDGPVAFEPLAGRDSDERKAFGGTPRAPLTMAISEDGGSSWPIRCYLEVGDGNCLSNNSRST